MGHSTGSKHVEYFGDARFRPEILGDIIVDVILTVIAADGAERVRIAFGKSRKRR